MEDKKIKRPNIDYSRLKYRPQHLTIGTSEKNSFYLQKSKYTPGMYRAYYEYDTFGSPISIVGTREEVEQEKPMSRTLTKNNKKD